jgi:hypothetical protein
MNIKKSQLKETIKTIARQCLNERCDGGHLAGGDKGKRMFGHVEKSEKEQGKSTAVAKKIAGATVNKRLSKEQVGADVVAGEGANEPSHGYNETDEIKLIKVLGHVADILMSFHEAESAEVNEPSPDDECGMCESQRPTLPPNKGSHKVVAPHGYTTTDENEALTIQSDPQVNETQRPTLPPNKGQYKTVSPHAYTTTDENEPLTIQTDPEVNEGDGKWIQKAVKHPGRCAHMGSPECPEGSPQYNLAKRFKKGDIHKANLEKECGACDEAGLTSEDEAEAGMHDETEEIKLLKVVKHIADKLVNMHKGMEGEEEPTSEPPIDTSPSEEPSFEEPEEPSSDEEPSTEEPKDEEPSEEPADEEPPKKKKKKEEDPTEFTRKLAKEYKVQKRSYCTSSDTSNDPQNVADPEIPGT